MGCDIHGVVEQKIGGKWVGLGVFGERSYRMFARMAGVRNRDDVEFIPPRGYPEDMSDLAHYVMDYWDDDGHSRSWLSGTKMFGILKEVEGDTHSYEWSDTWLTSHGRVHGSYWSYKNDKLWEADDPRPEDLRFVFCFDN